LTNAENFDELNQQAEFFVGGPNEAARAQKKARQKNLSRLKQTRKML
jgi:hypothetical protein